MNVELKITAIAALMITTFCAISDGYTYTQQFAETATSCTDRNGQDHAANTEWYDQENCERQECKKISGFMTMSAAGCPAFATDCATQVDDNAKYPDCCPQIVSCPESNEDEDDYYDY